MSPSSMGPQAAPNPGLLRSPSSLRKIGLLGSLYFSQGLPFGFFTLAIPVLLRKGGSSLGETTLSYLLSLPWALKFVWAPLLDRVGSPSFGRRRSWIVPMQLATVVVLVGVALRDPAGAFSFLLGAVFVVNLLSATQDIATDGFAVDMLDEAERGLANGVQVAGYRLGMIVGGGALPVLFDRAGARPTFLLMALLIALASIPILATRERPARLPPLGAPAEAAGILQFLRVPGAPRVMALLVIYKLGEAFATGVLRQFLFDAGLSLGDIGKLVGTVGFVAGLLGALAGGALVNRLGRKRALVGFAVLQLLTVAGYAYIARGVPGWGALAAICAAEHFGSGMATAALFTCMMDWCRPNTTASDYTIQACAVVIATGLASTLSGFSAQALGYFRHFAVATLLAGASIAAVHWLFPRSFPAAKEQIP